MTSYETNSDGHKSSDQSEARESKASAQGGPLPVVEQGSKFRIVKIAILIFLIVLAGIVALAYLGGDRQSLPFEYEGFD